MSERSMSGFRGVGRVGGGGGGRGFWAKLIFTAVKRVKFAKVKRNTSKLRLLLSLSKV